MGIISRTLIVFIAMNVSGCNTLYNANKDKTAQRAQKAFSDASIGTALNDERAALKKVQADRQALVARSQLALRDATIAGLLDGKTAANTWTKLQELIDSRIEAISGKRAFQLGGACGFLAAPVKVTNIELTEVGKSGLLLRTARINLEEEAQKLHLIRSQLAIKLAGAKGASDLSCDRPVLLPNELSRDGDATVLATAYSDQCKRFQQAEQCVTSAFESGRLAEEQRKLAAIASARSKISGDIEIKRKAYKDLLATADSAQPSAGVAEELAAKLEAALENFSDVTATNLNSNVILSRLTEAGRLASLREKKAVLEGYLNALAGNESTNASKNQHRVALVSRLVNGVTGQPAPPTAGILLEANFVAQQIAAAEARIERASEAERIHKWQSEHLLTELDFLTDARAHLAEAGADCKRVSLFTSLASGSRNPCSMSASKALLSFAAAWTAGQVPLEQGDYRLIDLTEQAALEESHAALTQNEGVVKAALDQLVALHGSGIRPEDIAAFAQAVSLPTIAVRIK